MCIICIDCKTIYIYILQYQDLSMKHLSDACLKYSEIMWMMTLLIFMATSSVSLKICRVLQPGCDNEALLSIRLTTAGLLPYQIIPSSR